MPGAPRPNKKAMKIAYQILKTPKDKQQDNQKKVSDEKASEWSRDSLLSQ
jgi:hypothetical protein